PQWYRSGQIAERIVETSTTAYRFANLENVQCTDARFQLSQLFCLDNILSDCVYPLDDNVEKCSFPWLLHGDHHQKTRIIGMNGLSAQLLHYFAKITFLSARLKRVSYLPSSLKVTNELDASLDRLTQWSEENKNGYPSSRELLTACKSRLDSNGKSTSEADVTDLTAESYRIAAKIYIKCRALRRPRQDRTVQDLLSTLLDCIKMQPTSGDLFTAQTPLFAVFIAGIVAYQSDHRDVIWRYFEETGPEEGSRGNVKPAAEALKSIWEW
ncbi:hypothetical protein K469DRAFT_530027, partial [Zopfia rhizophila CBS 207.26]